ncbi:MAG: DUF1499 domain-containing protein, partial [Pseudomonadota bacterium]
FLLLFVTVGVMAYIRLAPSDPARWHVPVAVRETTDLADGAVRVVPGGQAELHRLAQAMAAADRTRVLSGTVVDGRITYISRSRVFGFPDYTTLETSDGEVRAFARLRFGGSDLGVNAARLDRVFAAAGL